MNRRRWPLFAALSLLAACSGTERTGPGATGGADGGGPGIERPETVSTAPTTGAACVQNIDIVFVMDVSSSMGPFLTKLAQEISVVDSALMAMSPGAAPYYGLAVFVDETKILNNGQPFANVPTLRAEFERWAKLTYQNRQLDNPEQNSTWPENSLDAIYGAASTFAWRPGSLRVVIHTTDDTFWEGPTTADGIAVQRNYAETVTKLKNEQVRVFSFAAQRGGPNEADDVSAGWFVPYKGADPIPKATFGGVFEIEKVVAGQLSLSDSIKGAVQSVLCAPYPKVN